jgi:hypothetical protein
LGHRYPRAQLKDAVPQLQWIAPNLPFPNRIDGFVNLNRSPYRPELPRALLGVHAALDLALAPARKISLAVRDGRIDRGGLFARCEIEIESISAVQ